jgi:hypothetical protein
MTLHEVEELSKLIRLGLAKAGLQLDALADGRPGRSEMNPDGEGARGEKGEGKRWTSWKMAAAWDVPVGHARRQGYRPRV